MKVTRKALLADMTLTNDLGYEIEKRLAHLFCKGEGISPYEIEKSPQRLCAFMPGQALLENGSISIQGLAERFAAHLSGVSHAGRLKGSLVVYSVFPDENEGFLKPSASVSGSEADVSDPLTPKDLALEMLSDLSIPETQPWLATAHIGASGRVHMHLLFSRHLPSAANLALEGPDGWGLKRARRFIAERSSGLSRELLSSVVRSIPGIGGIAGNGREKLTGDLRARGVFIAEGPGPKGMKCCAWGASETFTFGE